MSDHVEGLLSAYIDHELDDHERLQVEEHLTTCPQCSSLLHDLMEMQQQVFTAIQSIKAPETLEDRIIDAIRTQEPAAASQRYVWLLLPLLSPLLIIAIALALTGSYVMKLSSIGFKLVMNLMFALGSMVSSDPYVITGLIGFSLLLMIGSGFSLKYLLKTKVM